MKTVILDYDPTWKALEWAKANCTSYITNQGAVSSYSLGQYKNIEYFFSDERDATWFRLMWG